MAVIVFEPGETVVRRAFRRDFLGALETARVVSDDEHGVLTWTGSDSVTMRRVFLDGTSSRKEPLSRRAVEPTYLRPGAWHGGGVLMLTPPAAPYSVWWFFGSDGVFAGWYVNLEEPAVRWRDPTAAGLDIADHALDIWVEPGGAWRWKDEDEFAERTGLPLFWSAEEAAGIRAAGEAVVAVIERREFPFDGTYCDFRPDPDWPPSRLPAWWDRPRAWKDPR